MTFIAEDGTGRGDANSLASVEFADAYHADRGTPGWLDLAIEVKRQLLIKATDYAVNTYAGLWNGRPVFLTQALPFPRDLWTGQPPVIIQQAIAELALIAKTTPLMPTVTRGKKRVKVGPLEVEYDGNAATSTKFVGASLRFAQFLGVAAGGPFARLVRT